MAPDTRVYVQLGSVVRHSDRSLGKWCAGWTNERFTPHSLHSCDNRRYGVGLWHLGFSGRQPKANLSFKFGCNMYNAPYAYRTASNKHWKYGIVDCDDSSDENLKFGSYGYGYYDSCRYYYDRIEEQSASHAKKNYSRNIMQ